MSTKLLLLYGGKSSEHEISLISAASVLAHLDSQLYTIIPVAMSKDGCLYINDYQELLAYRDSLPVCLPHSVPLNSLIIDGKLALDADVVFPVVHGPLYEDGCLQGLLRLADVAYVGCDVLASAIGMDKDMARRVACVNGIKSTEYRVLSSQADMVATANFCRQTVEELGWPLFVKPCSLGSSIGIHKAQTMPKLQEAIADARRFDESILVEAFVEGREIELAVLENVRAAAGPLVSVPGEISIHHVDGFYSYTAKYLESDCTTLSIPALLEKPLIEKLQQTAAAIFVNLKCRGMARVDFFVTAQQEIYFNEINTLPGFTSISMYPKLWEASGISYVELLNQLIDLALQHQRRRQRLVTHYQ